MTYLIIAETYVNIYFLLLISSIAGFFAGLLSIGGGLLVVPLLISYNIQPLVAVATVMVLVVASSTTSVISYLKAKLIDVKLAIILATSSNIGVLIGIFIFNKLLKLGSVDNIIVYLYVILLISLTLYIAYDLINYKFSKNGTQYNQIYRSASNSKLILNFPVSGLKINILYLIFLGILVGCLSAIMGIGGNIILIPILTILLKINIRIALATASLQLFFTSTTCLLLHSLINGNIDVTLALILILGGTIGAYYGNWLAKKIKDYYLRVIFFLVILMLTIFFIYNNFIVNIVKNEIIRTNILNSELSFWQSKIMWFYSEYPLSYSLIVLLMAIIVSYIISNILNFLHKK
ncbi:sulfite exporter TauE/SafE family protein [Bartonella sp. DGB1]|uniref:sulfite exporter TauE/SafE family protein n=1 Tax=Bartonella sp. DGB1 TaxID=3239807 RepID=UPI003523DDE8